LLLIEQGNAAPELISKLLQESVNAYVNRHHESPVDVIETIEQLLSSPSRSDSLMREIANRVKPWIDLTSSPPTGELLGHLPAPQIVLDDVAELFENNQALPAKNNSAPLPEVEVPILAAEVDVSQPRVRESDSGDDSYEMVKIESSSVRTHIYDASRFGSQDHLLDLLQRPKGKHQSLQDLLGALT
jgi:flagellar biosynthesis protein FlhG